MRLYALHPEQLTELDIGGDYTVVAGFLFAVFASSEPRVSYPQARKLEPLRKQWRNRAKPRLVVVQHEQWCPRPVGPGEPLGNAYAPELRDGCGVWTWSGGTKVTCWNHRIWGEHIGTLRAGNESWRVELDPAAPIERVRARIDRYYRQRALRVLAGNGAEGP